MAKKINTALLNNLSKRKKPTTEVNKAIAELHNVDENHNRIIDEMSTEEAIAFIKSQSHEGPKEPEKESKKVIEKPKSRVENKLHKLILDRKQNTDTPSTFAVSLQMIPEDYKLFNELKNKMKLDKGVMVSAKLFVHLCVDAFADKYKKELEELGVDVSDL